MSEFAGLTPIPPPLQCSIEELRTLFLFEKLTDEQLNWLCDNGHVEYFEPGPVYSEGDQATCFYVLLNGTVVLSRRVGVDDVDTTRSSQRGVYAGAMRAYLGGNAPDTYNGSMRVTEPVSSCWTHRCSPRRWASGSRWPCTCWTACSTGSRTPTK
jgi:hypothetical protein